MLLSFLGGLPGLEGGSLRMLGSGELGCRHLEELLAHPSWLFFGFFFCLEELDRELEGSVVVETPDYRTKETDMKDSGNDFC